NNGDRLNEFSGADEANAFVADAGSSVCVSLKWDNWPTSRNDFDLFVGDPSGNIVGESINDQADFALPPTEDTCFTAPTDGVYGIFIQHFNNDPGRPRFDLYEDGGGPLQYAVAAGSIGDPADSPNALAVGADCWSDSSLEPYSSRGPNI